MHRNNPIVAALLCYIESGDDQGGSATDAPGTAPENGNENGQAAPETPERPEGENDESAKDSEDEPLGEGGIKALQAEREAKIAAEKRAREAEAASKSATTKITTLEKDVTDATSKAATAENRAAELERELWLYKALAEHPVPEEHRHLVKGDTADELLKAAESVSTLVGIPGVVHRSGTDGASRPAVSSLDAGRQLHRDRFQRSASN